MFYFYMLLCLLLFCCFEFQFFNDQQQVFTFHSMLLFTIPTLYDCVEVGKEARHMFVASKLLFFRYKLI